MSPDHARSRPRKKQNNASNRRHVARLSPPRLRRTPRTRNERLFERARVRTHRTTPQQPRPAQTMRHRINPQRRFRARNRRDGQKTTVRDRRSRRLPFLPRRKTSVSRSRPCRGLPAKTGVRRTLDLRCFCPMGDHVASAFTVEVGGRASTNAEGSVSETG